MKPQRVTAKPQHGLVTKQHTGFFFQDKSSILPFSNTEIIIVLFLLLFKPFIYNKKSIVSKPTII